MKNNKLAFMVPKEEVDKLHNLVVGLFPFALKVSEVTDSLLLLVEVVYEIQAPVLDADGSNFEYFTKLKSLLEVCSDYTPFFTDYKKVGGM